MASLCDEVKTKLASYEAEYQELKEATSTLELAIWKANIESSTTSERNNKKRKGGDLNARQHCRINCRSDIIIGNVVPFLCDCSKDS